MSSLVGGQVKHENLPSNNINTYSPQSLYSLLGRANASKQQLFKVEILPLSTSLMPHFSVSHYQWFEKNFGQLVEQFFDDKLLQSSFFLRTIDEDILFLVMECFRKVAVAYHSCTRKLSSNLLPIRRFGRDISKIRIWISINMASMESAVQLGPKVWVLGIHDLFLDFTEKRKKIGNFSVQKSWLEFSTQKSTLTSGVNWHSVTDDWNSNSTDVDPNRFVITDDPPALGVIFSKGKKNKMHFIMTAILTWF